MKYNVYKTVYMYVSYKLIFNKKIILLKIINIVHKQNNNFYPLPLPPPLLSPPLLSPPLWFPPHPLWPHPDSTSYCYLNQTMRKRTLTWGCWRWTTINTTTLRAGLTKPYRYSLGPLTIVIEISWNLTHWHHSLYCDILVVWFLKKFNKFWWLLLKKKTFPKVKFCI